jgi:Predicted RNA-binding protein (contains KH domain)
MKREETKNAALLRSIVESFTRFHEDVEIESTVAIGTKRVETLKFKVNADDHPKVVGGGGKQIQSLRTVFQFIAARDQETIRVLLLEPERGVKSEYGYDGEAEYDPERIRELATRVLSRILVEPFEIELYGENGTVMLEIAASKKEMPLAEAVFPYLKSVFNAIGRHQGKELHAELRVVIEIPVP